MFPSFKHEMERHSFSTIFRPRSRSIASFLLLSLGLTRTAYAQMPPDQNLFQWKFANNFLSYSLPSCQTFGIIVEPVNATNLTQAFPPFYMLAWEIGGTPRTTLLGTDNSSLSWQVDHPVGTSLMLNVVDSRGNGGGITPQAFTVLTGQSTQCITRGNDTSFTVTANVTESLETCQPWGLRIKGGIPPYNISFAQFSSPIVTNVTVQSPSDAFTFINRATAGFTLLAAVSDITGRYAFGTPTVMPTGSYDVTCAGLNSAAGNATLLDQQQKAAASAITRAKQKRTATLAGVLTPLFVLFFGSAVFFGYRFYTKQQRIRRELQPEPMSIPEPKAVEEASATIAAAGRPTANRISSIKSSDARRSPPRNYTQNPFLTEAERSMGTSEDLPIIVLPSDGVHPSTSAGRRGFNAAFPTSSVRRSVTKAVEAGINLNLPQNSSAAGPSGSSNPIPMERSRSAQVTGSGAMASSVLMPARSASLNAVVGQSMGGEAEYIFQHEDAERLVRELPPPYERSRPPPDVPQSP
ncbi:hypothetical protein D9757_008740 [Collybiopsis confluens]|uniref:Transmembrane protein n=1 Tax=Collybiopsis confluens TaxID=2823264 RepID=A0A8H5H961_9AGAR|nr:hypothetical protein D9757_008740 [Collybiopsis confluens]